MAAEAYVLSVEDQEKLKKLMGDSYKTLVHHQGDSFLGSTPDVYIAKVQDDDEGNPGTIPALTPAAEGENYDHPGCAICDIYQIAVTTEGWGLMGGGMTLPVFNLSTTSIESNWVLVVKSKSGHWVAIGGWMIMPPIFRNDYGDTIPAYAILRVTGAGKLADGTPFLTATRPNDSFANAYIVNGAYDVPASSYGTYTIAGACRVLYDTGTPALGDSYGPANNVFTVTKSFVGGSSQSPLTCECLGIVDAPNKIMAARLHPVVPQMCWATTNVAVATGDATFTVTTIEPFGIYDWNGDDPLTVQNDSYRIGNGVKGKIVSCLNSDGKIEWHPFDFPPLCPDGSTP